MAPTPVPLAPTPVPLAPTPVPLAPSHRVASPTAPPPVWTPAPPAATTGRGGMGLIAAAIGAVGILIAVVLVVLLRGKGSGDGGTARHAGAGENQPSDRSDRPDRSNPGTGVVADAGGGIATPDRLVAGPAPKVAPAPPTPSARPKAKPTAAETCAAGCGALAKCGIPTGGAACPSSCGANPAVQTCLAAAGTSCSALAACVLRSFCGDVPPSGRGSCSEAAECEFSCGGDAVCVCGCIAMMAPRHAKPLLLANICANVKCGQICAGGSDACVRCLGANCQDEIERCQRE